MGWVCCFGRTDKCGRWGVGEAGVLLPASGSAGRILLKDA